MSGAVTAVACVGETMVSFIPSDGAALDSTEQLGLSAAGAESNVAMYLADHGIDARWVSRLGDDAFGRRVLHHVRSAGVDVSAVRTDPARPTGLLFKDRTPNGTRVSYYRHGSAASAMGRYVLDEEVMRTADLWHFTGITPALSTSCRELVEAALTGDRSAQISFDVNYRPALWREPPADLLRRFAQAADIVFVGLDEAQALWGADARTPDDVRTLLPAPRILVVKDAANAATAYHDASRTTVPALTVDVVEPVGAGDAFAAGFLAGLLQAESTERCLRRGHLTAASAISVTGDHGPLLDAAAFDK